MNKDFLVKLKCHLEENIIGQEKAIEKMIKIAKIGELSLSHKSRPKATVLLVGPTGVGKTQIAKYFNEYLTNSTSIIKLDMSEYKELGSAKKFLGDGSKPLIETLVDTVDSKVLLFDEIEKSNDDVIDLLLQILWDGKLTLNSGRVLDFKSYYIFLTSNIGSKNILDMDSPNDTNIQAIINEQLEDELRPELYGRIKEIIIFRKLSDKEIKAIALLHLNKAVNRINKENNYNFSIDEKIVGFYTAKKIPVKYGARKIEIEVNDLVEEAIAEHLINGGKPSGLITTSQHSEYILIK